MLILCDGAHARKWIKTKKHHFPSNSIVLCNSKRGLFEPSETAEFSGGSISEWKLVKPDIAAVLTDLDDKVLISSYEPSFLDLQKSVQYLFSIRKFTQVAIYAFYDELSALMLSLTLSQLELPENTILSAGFSVSNGQSPLHNSSNTKEFESIVSRMYLNYYTSHYFKKLMRDRLAKSSLIETDLDYRSITPLSMFILNLVFLEPGIRSVFVGRFILDEIHVDNFAATPLRSAEVQFAIDGLSKSGMIRAHGNKLFVTNFGVQIRSVLDTDAVRRVLRILLRPSADAIAKIDAAMAYFERANISLSDQDTQDRSYLQE